MCDVFFNTVLPYIKDNWVELTGVLLSLIYLYLSINQKISLWFFGVVSSLFYVEVFFRTKLYADMSLQLYYVLVSFYGWVFWNQSKEGNQPAINPMGKKDKVLTLIATIFVYLIYYLILRYLSDSPVPIADSFVGALSVIATWMLARKYIENWLVFLLVNAFCIGLYWWRGLHATSVLYCVYTIMSVVGYFQWKRMEQQRVRG